MELLSDNGQFLLILLKKGEVLNLIQPERHPLVFHSMRIYHSYKSSLSLPCDFSFI